MNIRKSWTVAMKDFSVFRRKRYILYSLIVVPLILSILFPSTLLFPSASSKIPSQLLISLLNSFFSIFIILAAIIPSVIASYSFVGEKIEKSLEPLLATPATDSELLLGKGLSAFIPSIAATYAGAAIFMILVDTFTYSQYGLLFPNWNAAVILVLAAPLACILSVEFSIIISARVSDIRTAQQMGALVIIPLLGIFLLSETNTLAIDVYSLLIISGILFAVDVGLFFVSRATFQREEILTRWK